MTLDELLPELPGLGLRLNNLFQLTNGVWQANVCDAGEAGAGYQFGRADAPVDALLAALKAAGVKFDDEPDAAADPVAEQRRLRDNLLIWAYAYEVENFSLVADSAFDQSCLQVDLAMDTGSPAADRWWREHFDPSTGQWVHKYPYPDALRKQYELARRHSENA